MAKECTVQGPLLPYDGKNMFKGAPGTHPCRFSRVVELRRCTQPAVVPPMNNTTMAIPISTSNNNYGASPPYASDLSVYSPAYSASPHLPPVQSSSLPRALERPSPMSLGAVVRSPVQSSPRQPIQSHWPGDDGYPPPSPSPSSPVRGPRALPTPGGVTNSPQRRANVDLHRMNGDREKEWEREREQKPQEETRRHAVSGTSTVCPTPTGVPHCSV
jgi:hypothetical protein